MSFEERMRSITHTLELAAAMQQNRKQWSDDQIRQLEARMVRTAETVDTILLISTQNSRNIAALAHIVHSRENRINLRESGL